jgi:hypothetical protein
MLACVTKIQAGLELKPCTFRTPLNQTKSPAGMAVPLKLAEMALVHLKGWAKAEVVPNKSVLASNAVSFRRIFIGHNLSASVLMQELCEGMAGKLQFSSRPGRYYV